MLSIRIPLLDTYLSLISSHKVHFRLLFYLFIVLLTPLTMPGVSNFTITRPRSAFTDSPSVSLRGLKNEILRCANRQLASKESRTYRQVRVLLLSWQDDDFGSDQKVKRLADCFYNNYKYEVQIDKIPPQHHGRLSAGPNTWLRSRLCRFSVTAGADDLLIFYYAGHGLINDGDHYNPVSLR